jgi:hypothetical protein
MQRSDDSARGTLNAAGEAAANKVDDRRLVPRHVRLPEALVPPGIDRQCGDLDQVFLQVVEHRAQQPRRVVLARVGEAPRGTSRSTDCTCR